MADYTSLKVADLKAELKRRGIPQTGLRLKQNFIDKLLEADAAEQSASAPAPAPEQAEQQQVAPCQSLAVPERTSHEANETAPAALAALAAPEPPKSIPDSEITSKPSEDVLPTDKEVVAEAAAQPPLVEAPSQEATVMEEPVTAPKPTAPVATVPATLAAKQVEQETIARERPEATIKPADETAMPTKAASELPTPGATVHMVTADAYMEEPTDDSRKRKRRSQSPPPSPDEAAHKKAKAEDGSPRVILKEDVAHDKRTMQDERQETSAGTKEVQREVAMSETPTGEYKVDIEMQEKTEERLPPSDETGEPARPRRHVSEDKRFKGLFPVANGGRRTPSPPPSTAIATATRVVEEDRAVPPAVHPATTSLYIRDLMRPLQPAVLKKHLTSLAVPPGSSPNEELILDFFLDSIKTHCFVTFANVSAASRVRSTLHGTIWPDERTRKPLWVDFIPEEKVKEWQEAEEQQASGNNGGRFAGTQRWEVVYENNEATGGVVALLREASTSTTPRNGTFDREPPLGPRATHGDRDTTRRQSELGPGTEHGFKALDERFLSTTAKPKLYYLPVSREVVDKRLDQFDDLARAGPYHRRGGDETRKYTFEDADFFVDVGPEYGRRIRRPRGGRGGLREGNWRGR